jgi:nitroimidazol reductase NimA-like FMN-containing flavoprotein (pyridoxamine 5'-phosphate oxidase superfamily)
MPAVSPLATEECWRLIDTATLGRLAFSRRALPVVYPVRFTASGRSLWFWLDTPALQEAAMSSDVVCFEVDAWAPMLGGWSVLVTGHLHALTAPWPVHDAATAATATDDGCAARLVPSVISGRRIDLTATVQDPRP